MKHIYITTLYRNLLRLNDTWHFMATAHTLTKIAWQPVSDGNKNETQLNEKKKTNEFFKNEEREKTPSNTIPTRAISDDQAILHVPVMIE